MPSSDALARSLAVLLGLAALVPPAFGFDPERDTWLLPAESAWPAEARRPVAPLEFARIRATANDQDPEYATADQLALIDAAQRGDRNGLEALLKRGVNPNGRPDLWGRSALIHAVERDDVAMVRLLLEAGADPDLKAGSYRPLGLAAFLGHARIARQLLRAGANPDLKSDDGNTPLTAAAGMNRLEAIRVLLAGHADYTLFNLEGRTALSVAALAGFEAAVRLMLESGVDANVPDRTGGTAMVSAGIDGHKPILALLVQHGAETR
ncbi:MAG: ankyrin repeat domain-containing protein [Gallionellaceae bacterium]|nr:ankyrin repeat domain-containing protein [Gallionellaceae bacterium]MDD5364353.1 ankyrin repeat domain-containing protein [Gallionellaceae bacterium]